MRRVLVRGDKVSGLTLVFVVRSSEKAAKYSNN